VPLARPTDVRNLLIFSRARIPIWKGRFENCLNLPRKIAIVELRKNNWPSLEAIIQEMVTAVDNAKPGSYKTVDCVYIHKSQRK
jgi:hypothetical protein